MAIVPKWSKMEQYQRRLFLYVAPLNILEGQGKVTKLLLTRIMVWWHYLSTIFISFFYLTPFGEGTKLAKFIVIKRDPEFCICR
jgi:hypothetical protein